MDIEGEWEMKEVIQNLRQVKNQKNFRRIMGRYKDEIRYRDGFQMGRLIY